MITAAGTMKPLPVRPVRIANPATLAPMPRTAAGRVMRPLPTPTPDTPADLVAAIRTAAHQHMLGRRNVQPLPVVDPS